MIEGQFKPFQSLQFEPLERLVIGGVEITFVNSANSTASTITWPGGLTSECFAVLFDHAVNSAATPSQVVPTDFTLIPGASITSGGTSRYTATYKYPLTGSESGSITGQNGNSSNEKVLLVFKISGGDNNVNFGGILADMTDANPAAQTTNTSGVLLPSIFFGQTSSPTSATSFTTASPSFDSTVSISNTRMTAGYKIYNLSPADHTIDMNDLGNRNTLGSFTAQFGTQTLYSDPAYTSALAAITNKTLHCRPDLTYGLNDTLTTLEWDNESVATPNITGTSTYLANSFGTYRGVLSDASGEFGYPGSTLSTIVAGSGLSYTMFAVEKRTGTQGPSTGTSRFNNSYVMGDSAGYLFMTFDGSSRRFIIQSYNGTYSTTDTGFDFTDDVPYVIAWKVESNGAVRVNFNGSIFTAGAGAQVNPSSFAGNFRINRWTAGTNVGAEYIVSSDAVSDTDMDNMVNALKTKYGI